MEKKTIRSTISMFGLVFILAGCVSTKGTTVTPVTSPPPPVSNPDVSDWPEGDPERDREAPSGRELQYKEIEERNRYVK